MPDGRGCLLPQGLFPQGCAPHSLFVLDKKRMRRARWKRKNRFGRAPVQWPSARDGSFLNQCRQNQSAFCQLAPDDSVVLDLSRGLGAMQISGWSSHWPASLFAAAHASAKNPAARSEAERAERETGQMRFCNPLTAAPAPRESAFKPVPHPAAPVGEPSQTRRHHLTPTPV